MPKEAYYARQEQPPAAASTEQPSKTMRVEAQPDEMGQFQRADANVVAKRKIVTASRPSRSALLESHIESLNESFAAWVEAQAADSGKAGVSWADAVYEYLAYVRQLREHYRQQDGIVLSFGTGDCGQLGHGKDENEDWIENRRPGRRRW